MVITGAISRAKLQSDHHHQQTNTRFLQTRCPSCRPTNSVRALKGSIILSLCHNEEITLLPHKPRACRSHNQHTTGQCFSLHQRRRLRQFTESDQLAGDPRRLTQSEWWNDDADAGMTTSAHCSTSSICKETH